MIKRISSKDIMDILEDSKESIDEIGDDVNTIREELEKRLMVIRDAEDYSLQQMKDVQEMLNGTQGQEHTRTIMLARQGNKAFGTYDVFGSTIHPSFMRTPYDIFNLDSVTGKLFKDNATVSINDTPKNEYKELLKDDSINGKGITYMYSDERYGSSTGEAAHEQGEAWLDVEVNMNDLKGSTDFNIIEFQPYLPGSMIIDELELYTTEDYYTKATSPSFHWYRSINNAGCFRFMLDKTRSLWKFHLHALLNYQNQDGKYPFGFKHIYFLNGEYDTKSKIIVKVTSDKFIDHISDAITVHDQNGVYRAKCSEEGIKLYSNYSDGELSYEITPSSGLAVNSIPRNIKEFYVSIPVTRSMVSIRFDEIAER